jgi:hypothetical protein
LLVKAMREAMLVIITYAVPIPPPKGLRSTLLGANAQLPNLPIMSKPKPAKLPKE